MVSAEFNIAPSEAGTRIDQFLAVRVPALSRARIQDLLKAGHILLNGRGTKASTKLRATDHIALTELPPIASSTEAEDIALDILHEDSDLIVLNKPPASSCIPPPGTGRARS